MEVFCRSPWTSFARNGQLGCVLRNGLPGASLWRVRVVYTLYWNSMYFPFKRLSRDA